jgi:hypothetical protein
MLAPHLLQSSLVDINTLLRQRVLADPVWAKLLTTEDRRVFSAPFWTYVNPYGRQAAGPGRRGRVAATGPDAGRMPGIAT